MAFKRFDGFYGSAPQKKIDGEVPKCPFCGRDAHWLLEIESGAATCLCEKCGAKLKVRCVNLEYESKAEVVSVGRKYTSGGLLVGSIYPMSELSALANEVTPDLENEEADKEYTLSHEDVIIKKEKKPFNLKSWFSKENIHKGLFLIGGIIFSIAIIIMLILAPRSCSNDKIELSEYTYASYSSASGVYFASVNGSFENVSGKKLSYVSLEFKLYGFDGQVVGTAWVAFDNVDKDEVRQFEAVSFDCSGPVKDYKLVKCVAR